MVQAKKSGMFTATRRGQQLFKKGASRLRFKFRPWMRNLGHDLATGKVLRLQEKARLRSLRTRRRKFVALKGAVGRKASRLVRTGAMPAAAHGAGVAGVSDTALRYFRQFASTMAGGKSHGGVTAYMVMHPDPLYDPIYDSCQITASLDEFALQA